MQVNPDIVKRDHDSDEEVVFCRRCGRKLIGKISKDRQFGPSCYKAWLKERSQQHGLFKVGENNG